MAFAVLSVFAASNLHASDEVEMRGAEGTVRGQITRIDDGGVRIRAENGALQLISWDRVRRVEAGAPTDAERAAQYEGLSEELWRARTRVERGDTALAEPIFEKHFERYRGASANETALVVAEGLLRCRLARQTPGARAMALIPALEVARLRAAGVTTSSYESLPRVVEEQLLLCPALAPVWTGAGENGREGDYLAQLEREVASYDAHGNETLAVIAALYHRSVQRDLEASAGAARAPRPPLPRAAGNAGRHDGIELMRDLVLSLDAAGDARRGARSRLERRLDDLAARGAWAEAWARYHIGLSMMTEGGDATGVASQRGVIHLAHLPARFGAAQPHLVKLALSHMIDYHESLGQAEIAASLRTEYERRFPERSNLTRRATESHGGEHL